MRTEFTKAINTHQAAFGLRLAEDKIGRLAEYYELVQKHNPILHLVAPCSPEEFAVRHVLESLTLLEFLAENIGFADVGAGAGLPSIPCLIVREDLRGVLIESKEKKARFLETAAVELQLSHRIRIVNRQFQETDNGHFSVVVCRALDKFTEKLPRLLKWAGKRTLLLFGGNNLRETLENQRSVYTERLIPLSEQRFLFIVFP